MKTNTHTLYDAIARLKHAAEMKGNLGLDNFQLDVGKTIKLTSTNLNEFLRIGIDNEDDSQNFVRHLPIGKMLKLLKPVGKAYHDLTLSQEGNGKESQNIAINFDSMKIKMPCQKPEHDFAELSVFDHGNGEDKAIAVFKGSQLKKDLQFLCLATSTDKLRPSLNTVHFGKDCMAATDGHKLFIVEEKIKESFLISGDCAKILIQLAKSDELILVSKFTHDSSNYVEFSSEDWILISREIQDLFPDISQIVPDIKDSKYMIQIESSELKSKLKRLESILSSNNKSLGLELTGDGEVKLKVDNADIGQIEVDLDDIGTEYANGWSTVTIGLQLPYLLDALKVDSDVIKIYVKSESDVVLIHYNDNKEYSALIMPIRL